MKRYILSSLVLICAVVLFSAPLYSQEIYYSSAKTPPTGERVLWDVLVMRPAGIVTCALGLGASIIALPFAAISRSEEGMFNALVTEPFSYTFARPVGQLDTVNP